MNTLKLYEEYINSGSNRMNSLLKNLVQSLNASFSGKNNSLGVKDLEGLSLIDIEQSNTNDAFEKNIVMRFSDMSYQYQMIFVLKLDDVKDNEPIEKAYMKLKIYDNDQGQLIREWQNDINIKEPSDEEMNEEGRWFLKIGENNDSQSQEDTQVQSSDLDFIENFILEKIGFLKEMLDKNTEPQVNTDE